MPEENKQPDNKPNENQTFTPQQLQDEIKKAVEKAVADARKEEKDKLYSDLQALKSDVTKRDEEISNLKKSLEKQPVPDDKKEPNEVAELKAKLEALTTTFNNALDERLKAQEAAFQKTLKDEKLKTLRDVLIEKAEGKIIPALVTGNTEEELRASVDGAKKAYADVFEAGAKSKMDEAEKKIAESQPSPAAPGTQGGELADVQGGLNNWRKMPKDKWEAERAKIKAEAYKRERLPMGKV